MTEGQEAAPQEGSVPAKQKERQLVYHAVLNDGTIVQTYGRTEFNERLSKYKPEDVRFACKGHELKAESRLSFG
jgi:hypothetical protein